MPISSLTTEQKLLLRLTQIPDLGGKAVQQILSNLSLTELKEYSTEQLQELGFNHNQIYHWQNPNLSLEQEISQWLEQENHHLITLLDSNYPYLLKQISSPPPLIFTQGNGEILNNPQLAIVGSRYCSSYGEYWAKYFASELCLAGLTITSGLALGIDGHCHQAVVDIQGQTIAVLGCGLKHIYPKKHQQLAEQILHYDGAIISEFLPSQPPIARHFPQRNRIISGLSLGTFVIEATEKSGSLITAHYAVEQNREVFALPSHIQNNYSNGCHKLIREGAILVEQVQDILEALPAYISGQSLKLKKQSPQPSAVLAFNPAKAEPIYYGELFELIPHRGISLDEILNKINLSPEEIFSQLLMLEMQGLISQQEGLYCRVV